MGMRQLTPECRNAIDPARAVDCSMTPEVLVILLFGVARGGDPRRNGAAAATLREHGV